MHLVARPGLVDRRRAARATTTSSPGRWSRRTACVLGGRRPRALAAVRDGRAAVQDEGCQLVALALAAAARPDGRRRPLARPVRRSRRQGGAARRRSPRARRATLIAVEVSAAPRRPGPLTARDRARARADGRGAHRRRPRRSARTSPRRTTGCWSTRRAPGSGRCAVGPRRAGVASPSDVAELAPLQRELLTVGAAMPSRPAAWSPTSPARRTSPRPASSSSDVLAAPAPTSRCVDARPLFADAVGRPLERAGRADVQLWPHVHGTDAMFLALLRRLP